MIRLNPSRYHEAVDWWDCVLAENGKEEELGRPAMANPDRFETPSVDLPPLVATAATVEAAEVEVTLSQEGHMVSVVAGNCM